MNRLAFLFVLALAQALAAAQNVLVVRVGLASLGRQKSIQITADSEFGAYDAASQKQVRHWKRDSVAVVAVNAGKLSLDGNEAPSAIYFSALGPKLKLTAGSVSRSYRGWVFIEVRADHLNVINEVGLETYLMGVVPCEMPSTWHPEALKAQSVAARTYTITKIGDFAAEGFDVDDTTRSHTYKGADAERSSTNEAIRATSNQILIYAGRPIEAVYGTVNGGVTASASEAFRGGGAPYLQSVLDVNPNGEPYAAASPHMSWKLELTPEALSALMMRSGRPIGIINDLAVVERSESGRAAFVKIDGELGSVTIAGADFRRALGVDSLRSTLFTVERKERAFVFTGKGWGHGVGMCQAGANGRANAGQSYREILSAYYTGASVHELRQPALTLSRRGTPVERRKHGS